MPAEWEPHEATWLAWPYNLNTWEGHLDGAEEAFVRIIEALTPHETVHVLVPDEAVRTRALQKLRAGSLNEGALRMHVIESGDVWFRDYGPIFLKNKQGALAYTKWIYNAYGKEEEYADLLVGNEVPDKMPLKPFPRFETNLVLEGGSLDVNGTGTVLTTESCLLSPDRNPGKTKADMERALKDFLGVTNVLWLSRGVAGDDTTGHIDTLTRFVGPATVVTIVEENTDDENYPPLQENLSRLQAMRTEDGTPLTVLELPMPKVFVVEGRRMAATYGNFYIANGVVLVPTYAQPSDERALSVLRPLFPGREVIGIDSRELIWGYGSIHCATQQQPA
jgi:agmatine deiminase